jgi:fatty acid desaturase
MTAPSADDHERESGGVGSQVADAELMAPLRELVRGGRLAEPAPARAIAWMIAAPVTWVGAYLVAEAAGSPLVWVLAWAVQAPLILSAVAGQHEAIHRNLFRQRWANHVAGQFWGSMLLFPYGVYRAGHLQHHAATHAPGDSEPLDLYSGLVQYLVLAPISGLLFLGLNWWHALSTLVGRPPDYLRNRSQARITRVSALVSLVEVAAVVVATVRWPGVMVTGFFVPALFGLVLVMLVTLPEHYLCNLGPASVAVTTRTTISNPVMRFFFWGTNFHAAHHLVAGVPSQRLSEVHEAIEPRLAHVERGYLRWHWGLMRMMASGRHPDAHPPAPDDPTADLVLE